MNESIQKSTTQEEKPEAAIVAAEQASESAQIERNVNVVPISQVLMLEAPDGKSDEVICYGEETDLGEGVTVSKAKIIPMEIAGLMDPDEPRAKQGGTKRALAATVAAILGGGAIATAANGCNFVNGEGDNAVNQMKKNLTSADYTHNFQDQGVACFSQPGDGPLSIGTLPNGDKIILFTRDASGVDHCFGVTAPDYQAAATQECVAQDVTIPGVMFPGGNPQIPTCTADGTRIAARRGTEVVSGDLSVDASGIISFQNEHLDANIQGSDMLNFIRDGGQQYLLRNTPGGIYKYNPDAQTQETTTVPDDCGIPSKDDAAGVWLGARVSGSDCMVVQSPTLQGLASSMTQIPGISGDYFGPSAGESIFFFNAADGNHYAIVLPYCGDGTCDAGENQTNCSADCGTAPVCGDGNVDTGEVCDDNNTVDGDGCSANCQSDETCGNNVVDTVTGEVCDDNNTVDGDGCSADCLSDETCGNNVLDPGEDCDDGNTVSGDGCEADCTDPVPPVCGDGTCEPPETNATCPEDCDPGPVCGDGTCEPPETNATCPADCDVIPPECEQVLENVEWTDGQCTLSECDGGNKIAIFEGPCTFDLTLPGGGVVNVAVEGEARVDAINKLGEPINYGDSIDFSTNGNKFDGKVESGVTGVSGTRVLVMKVQIPGTGNTGIYVKLTEDSAGVLIEGELMDTLTAGTDNFEGTWDLTTKERVQNTTDPDAGVDGGTGTDAGTGDKPGEKCGGCTSSGESNLPAPATILLAGIVAMALRRKKAAKIVQTEAPAEGSGLEVPGPGLYEYVSKRIAGTLDRIRK